MLVVVRECELVDGRVEGNELSAAGTRHVQAGQVCHGSGAGRVRQRQQQQPVGRLVHQTLGEKNGEERGRKQRGRERGGGRRVLLVVVVVFVFVIFF